MRDCLSKHTDSVEEATEKVRCLCTEMEQFPAYISKLIKGQRDLLCGFLCKKRK